MLEIQIFCENIKKLRKQNHLSKREMARILHISPKSLTQIENNTIPATISTPVAERAILLCNVKFEKHFNFQP